MSRKVLVLEDESSIRGFIVINLTRAGYSVIEAETGEEALDKLRDNPDVRVALLDIMLPVMDGWAVCAKIRETSKVPIIMLTAKSEDMDKLLGFEHGADDYLTKPFLTQELLLRIQRILQRCYRGELWQTAAKTLQLGQRTVYLADALVRLPDGTAQPLTATERALLQKLAENRGHIVTYDAVCEAVWGADYYGYENSLNVHIRHLREKLEPNPSKPQYLLTVRGIGYKLAEENAQ